MASTAADIITLSLKDIGVLDESETPSAALLADSLTTLNQMLAQWQVSENYVYAQQDVTFNPTGAESYTIGTGGTINVAAPPQIDYAFLRVSDVDYPIEILNTFEAYQLGITYKPVTTYPEVLYYNPSYSLGKIYLYPRPNTGTMHLGMTVALPIYTAAANAINIPPEYELAIRYSLSELLASMTGTILRPDIAAIAQRARRIVKRNNFRLNELDTGFRPGGRHSGYPAILKG